MVLVSTSIQASWQVMTPVSEIFLKFLHPQHALCAQNACRNELEINSRAIRPTFRPLFRANYSMRPFAHTWQNCRKPYVAGNAANMLIAVNI